MNVIFKRLWICFVIIDFHIYATFVNGAIQTHYQPPGRTVVKVEEDPLVDKLTKVNHNLKLVKLKKVKKVYTNIQDEDQANDLNYHLDRRPPTIVDINTKHNVVTQTPIPFLRIDKPIKNSPVEYELKNKPNDKMLNDLNDKKLFHSILATKVEPIKNEIKDERSSHIKKLFPSANKFKQLNLSKSDSNKQSTSANPFASSSNKSTLKTEFVKKITTKKPTTTANPIVNNQSKKLAKSKQFSVTTEQPKTFVYKPKRTTTYKPYVYSVTTPSTIEPILRIRKSKPTTTAQIITTTVTSRPSFFSEKVTHKNYVSNEIKDDKKTTKNMDKDKSDLETHNSSRKYAKLSLDSRRSNDIETTRSYTTTPSPIRTTSPYFKTTTSLPVLQTRSYLRTNSRSFTTTSYLPTEPDYPTTTYKPFILSTAASQPKRSIPETTTESLITNEIDKSKVLTASRKKPIHRTRLVRPTQLAQLTTTTSLPKLELTTQAPILTTYSPRFRSTTTCSPRFRSTTQTSSTKYLSQFMSSTTPFSIATTNAYRYKESDREEYPANELPLKKQTTEQPATSRFYIDKNQKDQDDNLIIPRKSKWIIKDDKATRQRKSDLSYTTPSYNYQTNTVYSSYEETTTRPILRSYVTTISSVDLKNRLKESEELVRNIDENEIPNYKPVEKLIERTPKSVNTFYQMRRPQPFLIDKSKEDEKPPSLMVDLKYEEPKRNVANANENNPDKEIYYKDTKIRKESKLVPQTYFYPTSAPSVDQLNERLSYLNKEKAKYEKPYLENKKYEKPSYLENSRNNVYQPKEIEIPPEQRYPNLPASLAYSPKQKTRYNPDEKRPPSQPNPKSKNKINNQPYIKSHFNLGHPPADSQPKYGNLFKVGKLSKPFSNQAPIPYFTNDTNENPNDNNSPPELYRYPVRNKEPEKEHDNRPFDFKNYNRLPNDKYARTDLDSERLAKRPLLEPLEREQYRKPLDQSYYERPIDDNQHLKQVDHAPYQPPKEPIEYRRPPPYRQTEYTPEPIPQYNTQPPPPYFNYEPKPDRPKEYSNDKTVRFNFNRIPAKVIYDKYNQKFSGHVNLRPAKHQPMSMHYANIPKDVQPIEYQRQPLINPNNNFNEPIHRPIEPNHRPTEQPIEYQRQPLINQNNNFNEPVHRPTYRPEYKPIYNNNQEINRPTYRPVYNDYNNYDNVNHNRPTYNEQNRFREPKYNHINNQKPINQPEYRPYNQINRPVNRPNQMVDHMPNNKPNSQDNLRFIYPTRHKEQSRDYGPVHYNQPIYYNQFINHDQQNNNQFNPQYNNQNERPQYNENNHLINLNQGTNQFNNAGHYRINHKPTKDVELINLNDIRPNLSLFNNKLPELRLLQNTVISHDIPI